MMGSQPWDYPLVIGDEPGLYQAKCGISWPKNTIKPKKGHILLRWAVLLEKYGLPAPQRRKGPVPSECQLH